MIFGKRTGAMIGREFSGDKISESLLILDVGSDYTCVGYNDSLNSCVYITGIFFVCVFYNPNN